MAAKVYLGHKMAEAAHVGAPVSSGIKWSEGDFKLLQELVSVQLYKAI